MSLDVRAAARATGAGALQGWAATPLEARPRALARAARRLAAAAEALPAELRGVEHGARLRAMSSGVGRDGRPLHWQTMPWDLTSNWSEEDRRAMLAYLRALAPVPGRVPGPHPPSPDDPVADTFGFGDRAIR